MKFCLSARAWIGALLACFCLQGVAWPQALYNIHLRSTGVEGAAGQDVTLGIGLANQPDPVTGFSFGVKHDSAKLTFKSLTPAADLTAALQGNAVDDRFYSVNDSPQGGGGITVAMILSGGATSLAIPAGPDHAIFDLTYTIAAGAAGSTSVEITGDLGSPKVPIILDRSGTAQAPAGDPATLSATVTITSGPAPFLRGDVNQSGKYDILDAIIVLDYLFKGASAAGGAATRENCLICFNVDGSAFKGNSQVEDAADIDLTDAVRLITYVFGGFDTPAAPFPSCGQPPAPPAPEFACKAFTCKPQ